MATAKKKLNKNARAWVKALRSGKYKQTFGVLGTVNGFGEVCSNCVFGVLCELAVKAKVIKSKVSGHNISYNGNTAVPPTKVTNWVGLRTNWGDFDKTDLTTLNDENRRGFNEIADIIEQKAAELFV